MMKTLNRVMSVQISFYTKKMFWNFKLQIRNSEALSTINLTVLNNGIISMGNTEL